MPGIIDTLRKDHSHMEQLLQILEREFLACERDGKPDLDILSGIINYFRLYPDRFHHPTEDLIFGKLQTRSPEFAANVIGIVSEHGQAGRRLGQLAGLLEAAAVAGSVSSRSFGSAAASFIANERQHIALEERQLFPAALENLTAQDWTEIGDILAKRRYPLIHAEAEACFEQLVERITHWERQDRAERAWVSQGW
jgi:hemerythrin-like domain-containing protein